MTRPAERRLLLVAITLAAISTVPAAARERAHHRGRADPVAQGAEPAQSQPPLDDLYRRRGYGIGGAIFGRDTALAGTCADLRFTEPASCGRGYGIYGNGLGQRFGF